MSDKNLFPSSLPIVCVAMRGVSDIDFAMVSASANVVPSVSTVNYLNEETREINIILLESELKRFKNAFSDKNLIITIQEHRLFQDGMIDLISSYGTHCEILQRPILPKRREKVYADLSSKGVKLLRKSLSFSSDFELYDGIIFKGNEGAGRVTDETWAGKSQAWDLEYIVETFLNLYPNKSIIPCGGVNNKSQIQNLLNLGAEAVGLGTLFAMSSESNISKETKERIIELKRENIVQIDAGTIKQNAIVFSEWKSKDDINNTQSLKAGILHPNQGHIFVGTAIDTIDSIEPFQSIVNKLIS
jgi:hypothetical protein